MVKLQIEGPQVQVEPLVLELQQRPSIEVLEQIRHMGNTILQLDYTPAKRQKIVKLMTKDGQELHIPLLDTIQAHFENIHFISGFSIEIFA